MITDDELAQHPDQERFWSKVKIRDDESCWPWNAARTPKGYGRFWTGGKTVRASRFAFELTHGALPTGHFACHSCDNPPCVNPAHLYAGTASENNADMVARGRDRNHQNAKTHCPAGHPYDGDNLYIRPAGGRRCRTCKRERRSQGGRG